MNRRRNRVRLVDLRYPLRSPANRDRWTQVVRSDGAEMSRLITHRHPHVLHFSMNPKIFSNATIGTPDNIPSVAAWADPSHQGWHLIVPECPFCGKRHTHGGGDTELPPNYGVKTAHCTPNGGQYNLVPQRGIAFR